MVVTCAILAAQATAQQGLYFRPQIAKKWAHNVNAPVGFRTDQGYVIKVEPNNKLKPVGIFFGLGIGYRRGLWFAEMGICEDVAEYQVSINATRWTSLNGEAYSNVEQFRTGELFSRSSVTIGRRILGPRASVKASKGYVEVMGMLSVELWHRSHGSTVGLYHQEWNASPTDSLSWTMHTEVARYSAISLAPCVMFKAFNKKGHSMLNVSLSYSHILGERTLVRATNCFVNYADGLSYTTTINGGGGGLYLALSKDIYLNNIFSRRHESSIIE